MSIKFVTGKGEITFFRCNLPVPWQGSPYRFAIWDDPEFSEMEFGYLKQGREVYDGHEVLHNKYSSLLYRPLVSDHKIEPVSGSVLAWPTFRHTVGSKGYTYCLHNGTYAIETYHRDWGGCIEDATLSIDYPYIEGHWKAYPGTTVPRGIPYYYDFSYIGDGKVHVTEHYRDKWKEYDWQVWYNLSHFKYDNGSASLPEHTRVGIAIDESLSGVGADKIDWPALRSFACRDAINDLDVIGINWYENLIGFSTKVYETFGDLITNLHANIQKAKHIKNLSAMQVVANAYLTKKYGIDNDLRDIMSVKDGLPALLELILQSKLRLHGIVTDSYSTTNGSCTASCSATIDCQPFLSGRVWTDVLGLTPSASNLWATIPFSFAVDWILHCGENLEQMEYARGVGTNRWNVLHIWYCEKYISTAVPPTFDGWCADEDILKQTVFHRRSASSLPDYVYDPPDYGLGSLKNHVFEGVAIVLNAW